MSRTTLTALAIIAVAGLFPACPNPDVATDHAVQGIVGGSSDTSTAHTAVAYIKLNGVGACTGTLASASWVVTAAHCTWDKATDQPVDSASAYTVCFTNAGSIDVNASKCSTVTEVHRHPDWDTTAAARTTPYSDVALLKLSTNAQTTWGITPISILPSALLSNLTTGKTVQYSGFGYTKHPGVDCDADAGTCGGGQKQRVSVALDTVCGTAGGCTMPSGGTAPVNTICSPRTSGGTCTGDDGGPAFLTVSGTEYVVGATSFGDLSCSVFGCSSNLAKFESFFVQYMGAGYANGHGCTNPIDCKSGYCVGSICCNVACAGACNACSTGVCNALTGTSCDDSNPCTSNDTCNAGTCAGAPKNCGTSSNGGCIAAPTCNPSTGNCEGGGPKADGSPCEDGDACTQGDTCLNSVCQSGPVKNTCPAPDSCHEPTTCITAAGVCDTFPAKSNGAVCDDVNLCTKGDSCLAGSCLPSSLVSCAAPDDCHEKGQCDSSTGDCPSSYPLKIDGTACNDHNACTTNDVCTSGACSGTPTSGACFSDSCHAAGTCDPTTAVCNGANSADGTACNDGVSTTENDKCLAGLCMGTPIGLDPCYGGGNCITPPDSCHATVGICHSYSGCTYPPVADGTPCPSTDPCRTNRTCTSGACSGGTLHTCTSTACQTATCDGNGGCTTVNVADGTACPPGHCSAGQCVFGPDAGLPDGSLPDGGAAPGDAGTPPADAASQDAAPPAGDAAVPALDAGQPDASVARSDSGAPEPADASLTCGKGTHQEGGVCVADAATGCGCTSAPMGSTPWLLLLVLSGMATRRRSR